MRKGLCFILTAVLLFSLCGCIRVEQRQEQPKDQWINVDWSKGYANLRELTADSDLIVFATVQESTTNEGQIVSTIFTMKIDTLLWGEPLDATFRVYMTGGKNADGSLTQVAGDPLMKEGEEYLLFCQENKDGTYTVLGGPQGRFRYRDGTLTAIYQPDKSLTVPRNTDADSVSAQIIGYLTSPGI